MCALSVTFVTGIIEPSMSLHTEIASPFVHHALVFTSPFYLSPFFGLQLLGCTTFWRDPYGRRHSLCQQYIEGCVFIFQLYPPASVTGFPLSRASSRYSGHIRLLLGSGARTDSFLSLLDSEEKVFEACVSRQHMRHFGLLSPWLSVLFLPTWTLPSLPSLFFIGSISLLSERNRITIFCHDP